MRRAVAAAEARRPTREDGRHERQPNHASSGRGRSTIATSASVDAAVVALVMRRERTVAVYCKGSGETVPCTRLHVADESYEGMRVVLWRTHAGMDVGEGSRRLVILFAHPSRSRVPTIFVINCPPIP